MNDLISRQMAIDAINHICPIDTEYDCTLLDRIDVRCVLQDLPSAQPERKKGKWIGKPIAGYSNVRCSACREVFLENRGKWNFCPNCGAKMEEE